MINYAVTGQFLIQNLFIIVIQACMYFLSQFNENYCCACCVLFTVHCVQYVQRCQLEVGFLFIDFTSNCCEGA